MSNDSNCVSQRLNLFQNLASLPGPQFEQVLFGLKPPAGNVPTAQASQSDRVAALLQWAESIGCGLDQVEAAYTRVVTPSIQQGAGGEAWNVISKAEKNEFTDNKAPIIKDNTGTININYGQPPASSHD